MYKKEIYILWPNGVFPKKRVVSTFKISSYNLQYQQTLKKKGKHITISIYAGKVLYKTVHSLTKKNFQLPRSGGQLALLLKCLRSPLWSGLWNFPSPSLSSLTCSFFWVVAQGFLLSLKMPVLSHLVDFAWTVSSAQSAFLSDSYVAHSIAAFMFSSTCCVLGEHLTLQSVFQISITLSDLPLYLLFFKLELHFFLKQ